MEAYHSEIGLSENQEPHGDGHCGSAAVDRVLLALLRQRRVFRASGNTGQAVAEMRGQHAQGRHAVSTRRPALLAKFLSTFALLVGFAMAIFHSRKQSLHDMIAGTLVVRSE